MARTRYSKVYPPEVSRRAQCFVAAVNAARHRVQLLELSHDFELLCARYGNGLGLTSLTDLHAFCGLRYRVRHDLRDDFKLTLKE